MCVPLHSRIVTNTPCLVYSIVLYTVHHPANLPSYCTAVHPTVQHPAPVTQRSSSPASLSRDADTHINNNSTALLFVSENYSPSANIMALVSKYLIGTNPNSSRT